MPETIEIRPSARILKVLGDIEFEPWQCIAELVDNSFDDFSEASRSGRGFDSSPRVDVRLPLISAAPSEGEVVVEDNGTGMDLHTLNEAVRAGWSSNDPFSKLGLFGMGFNVATARLGSRCRILSTREGDPSWVGVEIDLASIGDDFVVPVIAEEKRVLSEHGTRVHVGMLNQERSSWLRRNAPRLSATLGTIYSYLLATEGFELWVNDVRVVPRPPCAWDATRSVTYGSGSRQEVIPAVIRFDEPLPDADVCLTCGSWQEPPGLGTCKECRGANLVERARRIRGWVGIQRYLHRSEFGVDFLRNGRKILVQDKRLFEWKDPNVPLGSPDTEYPVELTQGGRIIGEVHLDHVPVNYHKDAFEWNDRTWIAVVNFLRGSGPLLPQKARQLGYGENMSPIGRLHRGYRRTDAGERCLVPGNGVGPINDQTREWAKKFQDGDPEYQSDAVWWAAVVEHERKRRQNASGSGQSGEAGSGDLAAAGEGLEPLGLGQVPQPAAAGPDAVPGGTAPPESEQERLERYRSRGVAVPSLSGDFGLAEMGVSITIKAADVGGEGLVDSEGRPTPVLMIQETGGTFSAFVDSHHEVFTAFPEDAADLLMMEVANNLRVRSRSDMPLVQAVALLKLRHLEDYKIDQATLVGRAQELLQGLRERMAVATADNPDRAWQYLNPDERVDTERNLVNEGASVSLAEARRTGDFLLYVPSQVLPRVLEEWPEAFLDGAVFRAPYRAISSPSARRLAVGRIVGLLLDITRLVTALRPIPKDELIRARYSLEILEVEWKG